MKCAHFARGAQRAEALIFAGVGDGVQHQLYKKGVPGGSRRGPEAAFRIADLGSFRRDAAAEGGLSGDGMRAARALAVADGKESGRPHGRTP